MDSYKRALKKKKPEDYGTTPKDTLKVDMPLQMLGSERDSFAVTVEEKMARPLQQPRQRRVSLPWAILSLAALFACSAQCFVPGFQALSRRDGNSLLTLRAEVAEAVDTENVEPRDEWTIFVGPETDVKKAGIALMSRLRDHGAAGIDASGQEGCFRAFRVMQSSHAKMLTAAGQKLAYYPQFVQRPGRESDMSPQTNLNINAGVIEMPEIPEFSKEEVLLAPSSDQKISLLSTAISKRIQQQGWARVTGLGSSSTYRIFKAIIRANSFAAKDHEKDGSERFHIWAVFARGEMEDDDMPYWLELVKGPAPE